MSEVKKLVNKRPIDCNNIIYDEMCASRYD
nr:MAG TPA: hypothetical protein [Caudoviricetes sp.]DAU90861.1 MAG TPA: hypothetical protein [Caudoviricetes sp.]